jgi:3-hydroxyacyl-CoA dehydrogenase
VFLGSIRAAFLRSLSSLRATDGVARRLPAFRRVTHWDTVGTDEAFFALAEGDASANEIDEGMKLGCNHPMGPLALADLIGLDVLLSVMEVVHHELGDPKYRPCPNLREMVEAGYLGRKTGRGVYQY